MSKQTIEFTINGKLRTAGVFDDDMLLKLLRDDLNMTGTKEGCGNGECGACTVLINGVPLAACLYPAVKVNGQTVETVEGLGEKNQLHPLQRWFLKLGAVQCGFCTPGLLMSAKAILDADPDPTPDRIKEAISGNLCRCTGYKKVVEAIMAASAEMRGETPVDRTDRTGSGARAIAARRRNESRARIPLPRRRGPLRTGRGP